MRRAQGLLVIAGIFSLYFFSGAAQTGPAYPRVVHAEIFHPAQLGKVNFSTSCTPAAQPTMEKGVALLHSFQYQQSEQTFAEAAQQDPH